MTPNASMTPWHEDAPHLGVFANFRDAIAEASFLASVTRRRYTVTYEPANCWWHLRWGFELGSAKDATRPWVTFRRRMGRA